MFRKNNGVPGGERHFFVPTPEHPMSTPPLIRQRYLAIDGRRVRYLRAGSGSPVVLIYANSATLTAHINRLSTTHTVFAFDNPGYCGSDPLDLAEITVADLADALAAAMHFMGFPKVPVFGTHTGAAIAIELAVRHPDLVAAFPSLRARSSRRMSGTGISSGWGRSSWAAISPIAGRARGTGSLSIPGAAARPNMLDSRARRRPPNRSISGC
jgi:pimeloyl-ACP methyl ester carboxylesterase